MFVSCFKFQVDWWFGYGVRACSNSTRTKLLDVAGVPPQEGWARRVPREENVALHLHAAIMGAATKSARAPASRSQHRHHASTTHLAGVLAASEDIQ